MSDSELLIQTVRAAGDLARGLACKRKGHWKKQDGTPISDADLAVNDLLRERLCGPRPDYGWLSEETEDDLARLERRRVWVVDPIDGTRAYLRGEPHWTVSVALVEDGRPILGVVYNPMLDEFFDARLGHGARLNGAPISVSDRQRLEGAQLIMHKSVLKWDQWAEPWPKLKVSMRNSMAYRMCLVANGAFDATVVFSGKSAWDLAAADLLVHEAGGRVSAHDGEVFTYNQAGTRVPNVLAAGPGLFETLLARAQARRA